MNTLMIELVGKLAGLHGTLSVLMGDMASGNASTNHLHVIATVRTEIRMLERELKLITVVA